MSFGIPVRNGLGLGLLASTSLATGNVGGSAPFTPASLFASGAPGFLLDATLANLSSLFQDSAGTIPAVINEAVGLVLDDSRDAVGTNGAKRVNLLTWTEAFNESDWTKHNSTISANVVATTDPLGTNTADKLIANTVSDVHAARQQISASASVSYAAKVYAKSAEYSRVVVVNSDVLSGTNGAYAVFNLNTGVIDVSAVTYGTGFSAASSSITSVGNGWYLCTVTATSTATTRAISCNIDQGTSGPINQTFAGNNTSGIYLWGADLRLTSEASTAPTPYQPITSSWPATMAGNHFVQSTPTARPVLSARVNLLTKTEEFNDAAWTKVGATVTANTTTAPDGTTTADTIASASGSGQFAYQDVAVTAGTTVKYSFYILKTTSTTNGLYGGFSVEFRTASSPLAEYGANIDSDTGALITPSGWGTAGFSTTSIVSAGNFWLITVTPPVAPATTTLARIYHGVAGYFLNGTRLGSGSSSKVLWGADFRVANDTASPAYQRVNTATDYNATGFPLYLRYDGVDDFMVSDSFVSGASYFEGADAPFAMFFGVRRLTTGSFETIFSMGGSASATAGDNDTINLAFQSTTNQVGGQIRKSAPIVDKTSLGGTNLAPNTGVITWNRTSTTGVIQYNGISGSAVDQTQPALSLSLASLGVLRRGTTPTLASYLNGRIYFPLVVLGRTATETEIANMESYLSASMGGGYVPIGYDFLVDANGDQLTDASDNPLYTIPLYS